MLVRSLHSCSPRSISEPGTRRKSRARTQHFWRTFKTANHLGTADGRTVERTLLHHDIKDKKCLICSLSHEAIALFVAEESDFRLWEEILAAARSYFINRDIIKYRREKQLCNFLCFLNRPSTRDLTIVILDHRKSRKPPKWVSSEEEGSTSCNTIYIYI